MEGDETFTLDLNVVGSGGAVTNENMTIWIKDNDEITSSGVFEWATDTLVIEESSPLETLEILRKDGTYGESSIDVAMYSGTATAGDDFKSLATTVDFGPGWDMKRIYWELAIDDFIHEGDEVFTVVLSNPQGGATLGAKHTMTVTILDDDPDAAGTFSILGTPAVSEGGGVAQVQVHRSGGTSGQVTVDFATSDGTAVSGSDYEAIAGTLTFESGEYRRTISIPINDDSLIEGAESFRVSISNPTGGASIGTAFSTDVTIQDNDFTPGKLTFDTADYRLVEESGAVRLKVLRQGGTKGVVTVNYSAVSKTAAAGSDFIVAAGTLTFHEGEIFKHIDVQIVDDAIPEFNETFQVMLSNPTGNASLGTFPTRTITIFDTDHLH